MGVRTAVQPQQLGQIGGSVEIAADALADEVALTAERDDVRLAEGLVLVGLAEQHFHGRHTAEAQRVEDGDAVVGVAARVQDDAVGPACGRLDLVDEVALVVGLEKFHFHAHLGAAQLEVIQQTVIIQLTGHTRLGEVHHVEVGAVND